MLFCLEVVHLLMLPQPLRSAKGVHSGNSGEAQSDDSQHDALLPGMQQGGNHDYFPIAVYQKYFLLEMN